jgi:hypothetical protein
VAELERKQDRSPVAAGWDYAPAPEARDIVEIEERYGLFVGGEFVEPRSGEWYPTISPASEEPLAEVAQAGAEDVALAVGAARDALTGSYAKGTAAVGSDLDLMAITPSPRIGYRTRQQTQSLKTSSTSC